MSRLILKHKLKYAVPFNCVVSDHVVYVSTDCDAEILQYMLHDFDEKFFSNITYVSRAWMHPRFYDPLRLNCSKQPVGMVFTYFMHTESWLEITTHKDLY